MRYAGESDGQDVMFRYWGKALRENDNQEPYHLLVYHALDVAAIGHVWWQYSSVIRQRFTQVTGIDEQRTYAWTMFFIALHDYGKFDIRFQVKAPDALQTLFPTFEPDMLEPQRDFYHGPAGYGLFLAKDSYQIDFSEDDLDYWQPWIQAVTGHHGNLPAPTATSPPLAEDFIINRDLAARLAWLHALEALFLQPAGLDLQQLPPTCPDMMAGFCSVCDWLGSNELYFCYTAKRYSLKDYWDLARDRDHAQQAFAESGLYRAVCGIGGMAQLFPDISPRQLQTLVDDLPIEPGLTIVEAPTGSGKTEMALAYAAKLLAAGIAESVVFALPTQATANAMLERLEHAAGKMFDDGASVVLAHGKDRYNPNFEALKQAASRPTVQTEDAERDASVQCVQWLGASRKRAFLGQIGVCTVDQVLLSVLPVRHQFVRAFGLRKSVLIVDEVHAYDAYMYGLLSRVLRGQQLAGGSVFLLSATLPMEQKDLLAAAWGGTLPEHESPETVAYPLITHMTSNNHVSPYALPQEAMPKARQVQIDRQIDANALPDDALCQQMIEAAEQGALVGVVCNLVAVAQELALKLRTMGQIPVDIFHARFRFEDRQHHELRVKDHYGHSTKRAQGRILVATQVIEQSLDLDFDWLISQLCPVDLLFQRMGRLHRHARAERPTGFEQPKCTVLMPADSDFGVHKVIYQYERVLWRTQQMLMQYDVILFPDAYRQWIEWVYQDAPWPNEPEAITTQYDEFLKSEYGRYFSARTLSKADAMPWADTEGSASRLTRDGDLATQVLLTQETPTGLALLTGKRITDLGEDEHDEAIDLNTVGVPKSWKKWLDADREGNYRLVLHATGQNVWEAEQHGTRFQYSQDAGLMMLS